MLINGIQSTSLAASDRGLAYGDGLFSTIKVESGKLQLWDFHLQRLQLGAQRLFFPDVDWPLLTAEVQSVAATLSDRAHAVIKIMLTRGSGGRGYSSKGCSEPQRIISCHDFPDFYQHWQNEGIKVILCRQQLGINPQLAGLKTLNRLEQVLIKHELEIQGAVEGIVCDSNGLVVEACTANIFIYLDNHWQTPKLDNCGVAGVKRRQVMQAAAQAGVRVREADIRVADLLNAQALCLSNALMGIVPVKAFQAHSYCPAGFALTEQLQKMLGEGSWQ